MEMTNHGSGANGDDLVKFGQISEDRITWDHRRWSQWIVWGRRWVSPNILLCQSHLYHVWCLMLWAEITLGWARVEHSVLCSGGEQLAGHSQHSHTTQFLYRHSPVHSYTGESAQCRQFICDYCDNTFTQTVNLKKHVKGNIELNWQTLWGEILLCFAFRIQYI